MTDKRPLQAHEERVVTERNELHDKFSKLSAFLDNPKFLEIDEAEQRRLKQQWGYMELYLDVLDQRIAAFGGT